jgi:hypothetical protein
MSDCDKLLALIDALHKHPKDKSIRKKYEAAYAKAVKASGCGGYCSNPYACPGGCYVY